MIIRIVSTLHNHSTLCDGLSTPQEMAEAALAAGMTDFGLSGHSYAPFDLEYSIADEDSYICEVRALQAQYVGKLRIFCGIEQDYYAPVRNRQAFDYVIGSVHYIRDAQGKYWAVDGSAQELQGCIRSAFGGDAMAMVQAYYDLAVDNVQRYRPDIIGHFDVLSKNNEGNLFFDEDSSAYRQIALAALEACVQTGAVFEVNTGAMFRGRKSGPYPADFLLRRLQELGARVTLSADCHDARGIVHALDETVCRLRSLGFTGVQMWENGIFVERPL